MNNQTTPISPVTPNRIMIVDDEEIVLVALRETLTRAGYQTVAVSNPIDALEILRKEIVAVVISDHQMPKMSGLQFLTQVKQVQPDTTRILITAVLSLDTVIDAINKGEIYRFIVKPWLREELLATVKNAVQRYELICRNSLLQATTLAMNEKLKILNEELQSQVARVAEQNEQLGKLNTALEENLKHSVTLCLQTMETFYPMLGSQARRVHAITRAMAKVGNLPTDQCRILEVSSWLYDIGLMGVSRQLIRKWQEHPGALADAERALIEQHPILGQELAGFVHNLTAVGTTIRAHHERFDGQGFPDGLAGETIPWLSRLLAVAVAYAECNLPESDALETVKLGSGSLFDPDAVRIFLRAMPIAIVPRKQREVSLAELRPGMVLAKGIYTASSLLLIPEGQQLNAPFIDKLQNHNRLNPINQTLMVYC